MKSGTGVPFGLLYVGNDKLNLNVVIVFVLVRKGERLLKGEIMVVDFNAANPYGVFVHEALLKEKRSKTRLRNVVETASPPTLSRTSGETS
jgi:hypothetical protein